MADTATALAAAVWPVDKPAGPTSHDVVATVRRALGRGVRVGHCGTLDPFATGLLVVLVGRATRLAPYLSDLDKAYLAEIRTGAVSATGDPEGPVTPSGPPASAQALRALLPSMTGRQLQRVPAHSAVKVGGERLYRKARRGEAVEAPEREVEIHDLRLLEDRGEGRFLIEVRCGKGTYVRQLAADIGERLGTGAYCTALRRTAVGPITLEGAVAPSQVRAEGGLSPAAALAHLPARDLTGAEAAAVRHGRAVEGAGSGPVALLHEGRLVAVARGDGAGTLRPAVVLEEPG